MLKHLETTIERIENKLGSGAKPTSELCDNL